MASSEEYSKLFEPGTIGQIQIKNRIVRVAAGIDYFDKEYVLKLNQELPYFEALARGGVGLIIIGATSIDRLKEKHVPGYKELTEIVHKYDCPIFCQFMHVGAWAARSSRMENGNQVMSASAIPLSELRKRGPSFPIVPRELTIPEIKDIVGQFASAAQRARKACFDGIEINAATCHLGNSFLSRAWNRRQDEYGCQSLENRARFVVEIKDEIKKRLGQAVPVGILINGAEFGIKDGLTYEETQGFARIFEKAGFDYINVRVYGYVDYWDLHLPDSIFFPEPPKHLANPLDGSHHAAGLSVPIAAAIKKVVSTVPVITAGKIDAKLGEKILEQGKADFIGMARSLIVDPEYPNKVVAGRLKDIVPCISCYRCFKTISERRGTRCTVNAALGSEWDYVTLQLAPKRKKVVIIGAGPAGLEAARVAALRGHEVTVYDKMNRLGGLLLLIALVKNLDIEDIEGLVDYFENQLTKLGIRVRLGTEVDLSLIQRIQPEVVVTAIGGVPTIPRIHGINRRNVFTMPELHRRVQDYLNSVKPSTLRSLKSIYFPVGKKVIVMGGGLKGGEIAEFMVKRGRQVTFVDSSKTLEDSRLPNVRTLRLFRWFAKKGVSMMTGVKYDEITNEGLIVTDKDGERQILEANTIIPVSPAAPNTKLFRSLQGSIPEVYCIGDCRKPRLILEAIADGNRVARNI